MIIISVSIAQYSVPMRKSTSTAADSDANNPPLHGHDQRDPVSEPPYWKWHN